MTFLSLLMKSLNEHAHCHYQIAPSRCNELALECIIFSYPVRVHTCSYYRVLLTVASQLYLPSILVLYTIRYEKKEFKVDSKSIAVLQSGVCEINLAVFVHYLIFFPWIFYRAVFSSQAFSAPP